MKVTYDLVPFGLRRRNYVRKTQGGAVWYLHYADKHGVGRRLDYGPKLGADVVRYLEEHNGPGLHYVAWVPETTVYQARPGRPSVRHQPATAASYAPVHGGYPGGV